MATSFVVVKDGFETVENFPVPLPDSTYIDVGFYYDGKSSISYFLYDQKLGTVAATNLPDDELLTISFGIQNGEAAAKSMAVDYILAAKTR